MNSFQDLPLSPVLMQAIAELGYEKPSAIQAETLPILLGDPTDFMGLAATGTGKTAAFALPLLERVDPAKRSVQGLILCPTRELAVQVAGQIALMGKHKGVRALPVYGGASYGDQIHGLKAGANVVVGTPGRVIDHLERGTLKLSDLSVLVLDEADEMISMGFKDELEAILQSVPRETSNVWLFSATMSREVRKVADQYLREPRTVQINKTEMLAEGIEQIYYMTKESDKPEILCKLLDAATDCYGLVFCQTKALVMDLTQYLGNRGYRVDCLHGDMDQNARERTMRAFRERKVELLICTDVASRGLDVKDITHVFNYSIPRELDNYVHRIGRTARSGKTGFAMSLVTPSHRPLIGRIERMTQSRMIEGRIPTRKELGIKKVSRVFADFSAQEGYDRAAAVMDQNWRLALQDMSPEEVAGRFLALMFPDVFVDRAPKPAGVAALDAPLPSGAPRARAESRVEVMHSMLRVPEEGRGGSEAERHYDKRKQKKNYVHQHAPRPEGRREERREERRWTNDRTDRGERRGPAGPGPGGPSPGPSGFAPKKPYGKTPWKKDRFEKRGKPFQGGPRPHQAPQN